MKLSRVSYPESLGHIERAVKRGAPSVVHVERASADEHRDQSLRGIATKRGYDRDEWPMAFTKEGGKGADIEYVTPKDNRGAGSTIAGKMSDYCSGQAFTVKGH